MSEFINHLTLKINNELPAELAVRFFDVVNTVGPDDIVQTMEDSVMVHYVLDNMHNYEINLTRSISEASATTGEPMWEMPTYSEYGNQYQSDVADFKNTGGRAAGSR